MQKKAGGFKDYFNRIILNPSLYFLIGFALLILTGAVLLNTPFVTETGESIGFINALFTAGSASCVTGLVVVNTAYTFNFFGELVLLILIQIGGLGVMTLATIIPLLIGKRIGLASRQILKEQLNVASIAGIIRLLRYVLAFTFTVEGIGASLLAIRFIPLYGLKDGLWHSIFHAVSAFCNAGFDILGDSIYPFRGDFIVNYTIMALVVIGGIGFFVTQEIVRKRAWRKISTHAKLVLVMTIFLIFAGALFFFGLEYTNPNTLANESLGIKINQALFHSVISRTAGFYSIQTIGLRDATSFLLILLMFVGGSPGSTAGGLKTTTFGVLIVSAISTIKGENEPVIFRKHISESAIKKALALVVFSLLLVIGVSFTLTVTEDAAFIDIVFETVSAYATVGLTKGITPDLSNIGKIILTLTMYFGRVGPLTLGYAITNRHSKSHIRYPEANIAIG